MDVNKCFESASLLTALQLEVYQDLNTHQPKSPDVYSFAMNVGCGFAMLSLELLKKITNLGEHIIKYLAATLAVGFGEKDLAAARPFQASMIRESFSEAFNWNLTALFPVTKEECKTSVGYFELELARNLALSERVPNTGLTSLVTNLGSNLAAGAIRFVQ